MIMIQMTTTSFECFYKQLRVAGEGRFWFGLGARV